MEQKQQAHTSNRRNTFLLLLQKQNNMFVYIFMCTIKGFMERKTNESEAHAKTEVKTARKDVISERNPLAGIMNLPF